MENYGAPLLLTACRHGHMKIVEYLLEIGADIEQPGSIQFDGDNIAGARPLWAAAAAGHYNVVEFLLDNSAEANSRTQSNSTPLRAACYDGHKDIVELLMKRGADVDTTNRHGHTCLMIACFRSHCEVARMLIEQGADVNKASHKGNTALHDAAEAGDLNIIKLLLENGAKMRTDTFGTTPMLTAAMIGHSSIIDYLVASDYCDVAEKISGLELLGATCVDKQRDLTNANKFWQRALLMRASAPAELGLDQKAYRESIAAFDFQSEVNSLKELEEVSSNPDQMRMQALLIRERVLGPSHPDTSYYLRFRGAVYMDFTDYDRCFDLWLYALKLQQYRLEPFCVINIGSFVAFTELFAYVLSDTVKARVAQRRAERGRTDKVPRPSDVLVVLRAAVDEVVRAMQLPSLHSSDCIHEQISCELNRENHMNKMCLVCVHLASIFCRLEMQSLPEQDHAFKKVMYDLVKLNPLGTQGVSLLHLACSTDSSILERQPISRFPCLPVIRTLLSVDADPCAKDTLGNTPLHVLLRNKVGRPSIVQCLLKSGAHIDTRNRVGSRPVDLLKPIRGCEESNIKPLSYTTLKCCAARAVKHHRIYYRHLMKDLQDFIDLH